MNKEKFYTGIKNTMYRKFERLEIVEHYNANILYLRFKHEKQAQIVIKTKSCNVYYYYRFKFKIDKLFPIQDNDFEILLKRWVEDKFKMKVNDIFARVLSQDRILMIPTQQLKSYE